MGRPRQDVPSADRAAGRQHLGLPGGQGRGGLAVAAGGLQHLLGHQPDQRAQPQRPPRPPLGAPQQAPVPLALLFGRAGRLQDVVETLGLQGLDAGGEEALLQRGQRPALLQRLRHHAEELQLQPPLPLPSLGLLLRPPGARRPPGLPGEENGTRRAGRRAVEPRGRPGGHAEVPVLLSRPLLLLGARPALGQQHARLHAAAGSPRHGAVPQPLAALRPQRQEGGRQAAQAPGGAGAAAVARPGQNDPEPPGLQQPQHPGGGRRPAAPRPRGGDAGQDPRLHPGAGAALAGLGAPGEPGRALLRGVRLRGGRGRGRREGGGHGALARRRGGRREPLPAGRRAGHRADREQLKGEGTALTLRGPFSCGVAGGAPRRSPPGSAASCRQPEGVEAALPKFHQVF